MEEEREGGAEAGGSGDGSGDEGLEDAGQEDVLETSGAWEAGAASGGGGGGGASSVGVMTADFAMQNVLLQMGLRLLSRDGRVVSRLSRWALRCSACFFVTREAGRLFCPKCGNMSLDRVEVAVGPDGAEYFGVRKRHILRGTKFSLPKPRVSLWHGRKRAYASCWAWGARMQHGAAKRRREWGCECGRGAAVRTRAWWARRGQRGRAPRSFRRRGLGRQWATPLCTSAPRRGPTTRLLHLAAASPLPSDLG
jgi:hypothetical protein